ncbi:MAG: T9SS type A sorting domain-containing protein [Bacteroidota bacterium]
MFRSILLTSLLAGVALTLLAQPPNDDCINAINIPNVTSQQTIQADFTLATESLDASCETVSNNNRDVWYQLTMPYDGRLLISNVNGINRVSVYDACGGSELACIIVKGFVDSLSSGANILLRMSTIQASMTSSSFKIQSFAPASNDECSNAISIGDVSLPQQIQLDTREAYESLDASCESPNQVNQDLWYTFSMPFDGKLRITGVFGFNRISLYDQCAGTDIACFSGNGFVDSLNSGTTYWLRYSAIATQAIQDNITVQAFATPANDICSQSVSLGDLTTPQIVNIDPRGAYESMDVSCEDSSLNNLDLWYHFTMPYDGKLSVTGVFGVNKITVFDSCGGMELGCELSGGFFYGLQAGKTYVLRYGVYALQSGSDDVTFQAFPPAPNDECSTPDSIPDISVQQFVSLDTREATESIDVSCEDSSMINLDLWYAFTMPYNGMIRLTGVFGFNKIALFDTCGGNELACQIANGFIYGLDSAKMYLLRYAATSGQADVDQFGIQAFEPPANDACTSPDTIGDLSVQQIISLDTREATETLDASCETANLDNLDLWYEFTMPYDGMLNITGVFGMNRIAVFDSCGGNEIDCLIGNGFIYGLDSANTYLLRYAAISSQAVQDQFNIQAFSPPSFDECQAPDSIGDISQMQLVSVDTRQATESLDASCEDGFNQNLDLWFEFRMPFDGKVLIDDVAGANTVAIWDSCGGIELWCQSGNGIVHGLDSGQMYVLRYASISQQADQDVFSIQAFENLPNDECTNPMQIPDITNPQTIQLDTREATESLDASCENASQDNLDLWFSFDMPFDGKVLIDGFQAPHTVTLWDSCGGSELDCSIGNQLWQVLDSGQQYVLRFASPALSATAEDFSIVVFPLPHNDICDNAEMVEDISMLDTLIADTRYATETFEASCEMVMVENQDVWYQFSMPFDGSVEINGIDSTSSLTLLDTCSGNEIDCLLGDGSFAPLLSGNNYFLRYASPAEEASIDSFEIVAVKALSIADHLSESMGLQLFPNPAHSLVHISGEDASRITQALVYDITGTRVGSVSVQHSSIDVSRFPPALYVLILPELDFPQPYKLLIQRD